MKERGVTPDEFRGPIDHPLSERELNSLLRRVLDRFSWTRAAETYTLVSCWSSRTADMYHCRGATTGAPDVLVKAGRGWEADVARKLFAQLDQLGRDIDRGSGTVVRFPPVLGWDERPPSVCMPYIEGTDILFLYADLDHPEWGRSRWRPLSMIAECGRALGAYHVRSVLPPGSDPGEAREQADQSLRKAAAAMHLPEGDIAALARSVSIRPNFGDIGPHQFRLSPGDELYLLDPPMDLVFSPIHQDIAWFLFGLEKKVVGRAPGGRPRGRRGRDRLSADLREAFLDGYAETGAEDVRTPEGDFLLTAYEGWRARGAAYKRLRLGQYSEAARFAAAWARRLLTLRVRGSGGPGSDHR